MAATRLRSLSISHEAGSWSRQRDDFYCFSFGPLLASGASLWEGGGSRTGGRCCGADGERQEVCKRVFLGLELGWRHYSGLLQGVEFPLRLLASPVKAAGGKRVVCPEVSATIGHTQAVSRFCGERHLNRDGGLKRQRANPWLQTRSYT